MVAPADHPRRVLHYQAAIVHDQDGVTARCLELGWLCAHGRSIEEALARLRDLGRVSKVGGSCGMLRAWDEAT